MRVFVVKRTTAVASTVLPHLINSRVLDDLLGAMGAAFASMHITKEPPTPEKKGVNPMHTSSTGKRGEGMEREGGEDKCTFQPTGRDGRWLCAPSWHAGAQRSTGTLDTGGRRDMRGREEGTRDTKKQEQGQQLP